MQEENYKLTWHTYSNHLRDMMEAMMINDNFADVTLVTDDRKKIKAHRNILSACSSVFKDILEIDPQNNHPLIYLKGIQYTEMESILQFIYLGEARFYEGRMIEFLDAAKNLSIRELGKSVGDGESFLQKVLDTNKMIYEPNDNPPGFQELIDGEEEHRKIHGGGNQCDQQFTQQSNLKTNIQSQHRDEKYACDQCDYQATQQSSLTTHIQSKHECVKYTCDQCDYQATKQATLKSHIQSKHKGAKYACDHCQATLQGNRNLSRHIKGKHEGVKYSCNQCEKQYTDQSTLTKHIGSVHQGVKYPCNQCDKQFTGTNKLARHIRIIHEGVTYPCKQCNYEATQQSHLNNHILSVHTLNMGLSLKE